MAEETVEELEKRKVALSKARLTLMRKRRRKERRERGREEQPPEKKEPEPECKCEECPKCVQLVPAGCLLLPIWLPCSWLFL